MLCRRLLAVLSLFMFGGCLVEPAVERTPSSGEHPDAPRLTGSQDLAGECRTRGSLGCFDGHIVSKAEFAVEGRSFFNADDFAARFCELISIEVDGVTDHACELAEMVMLSPIDMRNFLTDFEYYLQGAVSRSGKVRSSGNFSMHELPEGSYRLRVQKPIRFQMTRAENIEVATPATSTPAPSPAPAQKRTRLLCATLYADAEIELARGKRTWDIFKDFKLHVTDQECVVSALGAEVRL